MRVQSHQGHLRLIGVGRGRALRPLLLLQLLVNLRHAHPNPFRGRALQVQIEGRIDAESLRDQLVLLELRQQLVFHHIDEKGCLAALEVALGKL